MFVILRLRARLRCTPRAQRSSAPVCGVSQGGGTWRCRRRPHSRGRGWGLCWVVRSVSPFSRLCASSPARSPSAPLGRLSTGMPVYLRMARGGSQVWRGACRDDSRRGTGLGPSPAVRGKEADGGRRLCPSKKRQPHLHPSAPHSENHPPCAGSGSRLGCGPDTGAGMRPAHARDGPLLNSSWTAAEGALISALGPPFSRPNLSEIGEIVRGVRL